LQISDTIILLACGLLHHESDPRIEEYYTDTAGFTDHVFALMDLPGFRFARASTI
jgi:TnpA family transposase